jgi:hypothetical protein
MYLKKGSPLHEPFFEDLAIKIIYDKHLYQNSQSIRYYDNLTMFVASYVEINTFTDVLSIALHDMAHAITLYHEGALNRLTQPNFGFDNRQAYEWPEHVVKNEIDAMILTYFLHTKITKTISYDYSRKPSTILQYCLALTDRISPKTNNNMVDYTLDVYNKFKTNETLVYDLYTPFNNWVKTKTLYNI